MLTAKPWAVSFYHSSEWLRTREAYMNLPIRTDRGICPPGMCERCFSMGVLRPANTVHHVTWLTPDNIGDPSVSLSFDNLMRVCMDCHAAIHSGLGEATPRVAFDSEGNVVPLG